MKIIYFGNAHQSTTSRHKAEALRRLGHSVTICDPYNDEAIRISGEIARKFHYRTGYLFQQAAMNDWLKRQLLDTGGDVAWIDSGELFGPACVKQMKEHVSRVIFYNHDDVTGPRDGFRFHSIRKALRFIDISVVVRSENLKEYEALGARNVVRVWRSYDEIQHRPFDNMNDIPNALRSEVAFVGTWMRGERRDVFLRELRKKGVPISIWGARWQSSPLWSELKDVWRGPALSGRDYVAAIQGAKVCLGMLSKGNRDEHTTRSLEIPYANGLLCAERTPEHETLFKNNEQAVFWRDADECAQKCLELLGNDTRRAHIRMAGAHRVRELKVGHEDICRQILDMV